MAAQSGTSQVWIWQPAQGDAAGFRHPACVPAGDEAQLKACFLEQARGPRSARIGPAALLQMKGNVALIAERGATREVPRAMVLPWYEGLLLLEVVEALQVKGELPQVAWCDSELKGILEQERAKYKNGQLSSALYTEKRLVNMAVTGALFVDGEDREWAYRRENLRADDRGLMAEAEEAGGYYKVQDVVGYLPPWEAFCHKKCGFYQDFYSVRWRYPWSEVDYSRVENGSTSAGATWEPDECLPAHLDPLRIAAKRAWIRARREAEMKAAEERQRSGGGALLDKAAQKRPAPEAAVKKEKEPAPEVKRARVRRDGAALERDICWASWGHDFMPSDFEQVSVGVRSGWPKRPQDYPKGYAVASPPGFCSEHCDCMDDQRPQQAWETNKAWLEDPVRSTAAGTCIEVLSQQTHFVRRRGTVSMQAYFETAATSLGNEKPARAALHLAGLIESAIHSSLRTVPTHSLAESEPPVLPASAALPPELDYTPLSIRAGGDDAASLPEWLRLEPDDGRLWAVSPPVPAAKAPSLRADIMHCEGAVGSLSCVLTQERLSGTGSPWAQATLPIGQYFADLGKCPLDAGVREALEEHVAEVFDVGLKQPVAIGFGAWLGRMTRLLRMTRTAAIANTARATAVGRVR